jgi:hypothetical protein
MGNPIKHADSNKGNISGISGVALSGFRAIDAYHGYEPGTFVYDDLVDFASDGKSAQASVLDADDDDGIVRGYSILQDGTTELTRKAEVGGVLEFEVGATNNDAEIKTGAGVAPFCKFPNTAADRKNFFFEAKVRISDVSNASMFVGVKEPTLGGAATTTQTISDTDNTLTSGQSLIGFWLKTNGDLVGVCSNAGTAVASSSLSTLTDATWVKLTVVFNEGPADSGQLVFAVDGTPVLTYNDVTATGSAVVTALDVDINYLGVVAFHSESGEIHCDVDHIAYGYEGAN